jgi:hypothetical protein
MKHIARRPCQEHSNITPAAETVKGESQRVSDELADCR